MRISCIAAAAAALAAAAATAPASASMIDPTFNRGGPANGRLGADECSSAATENIAKLADGSYVAVRAGCGFALERWTQRGRYVGGPREDEGGLRGLLPLGVVRTSQGRLLVSGLPSWQGREVRVRALRDDLERDPGYAAGGDAPAAGATLWATADGGVVTGGSEDGAFVLGRLDADGRADAGFGTGGVARTAIALPDGSTTSSARLEDLFVRGDGRIVAAGTAWYPAERGRLLAVARYLPDGKPDPTFGGDGVVVTRFRPAEAASVAGLHVDARGATIVSGTTRAPRGRDRWAAVRLLEDGSPDAGFRTGGSRSVRALTGEGGEVVGLPGERLAMVGSLDRGDHAFVVARLLADGRLDRGWGAGGMACAGWPRDEDLGVALAEVEAMAEPDGRVVVASAFEQSSGYKPLGLARTRRSYRVALDCPWSEPGARRGTTAVHVAVGRAGKVALEVTRLGRPRAYLGRAVLGWRTPGVHTLTWNRRVRGRRVGHLRLEERVVLLDRRGRTIARGGRVAR